MSDLMEELYYETKVLDPNNVSVQAAFICMLNLANDNDLGYQGQQETDFKIK